MNTTIKKIIAFFLFAATFAACKKEDNQVTFVGGSPIVASSNVTGNIPLLKINKDFAAATLTWTNPNYKLSNGISSQDVNYTIQIDTVGGKKFANFTTVKSDLSKSFTQGELNDFLIKDVIEGGLGLSPDVTYSIKVRIKSSIGLESDVNATNQFSNILTYTVKPYSVDPDLWITGDACVSSWTNAPPAPQKFAYNRVTKKFTITQAFVPGKLYKFLTVSGAWQPQWGGCPATGGAISVNPGGGADPDPISTPSVAGTYTITVDLVNKTCTIL